MAVGTRKSSIGSSPAIRYFRRFAAQPWIANRILALQFDKWFFKTLHPRYREGRAGRIRQVSLRITDVCNLRCRTCGQWGEKGFLHEKDLKALRQDEVPVHRYINLFRDLHRAGHRPLVYLWGGEPMLYPGAVALIEQTSSLGFPTSIATNGTNIANAAERLVEAPLFLLQLSIDGHNAELHNRIRPAPGRGDNYASVGAALDTVRMIRENRGVKWPLIASLTTISRDNVNHLVDIYESLRDRVEVCVFYLSWWIDEDRAAAHEKEFERRFSEKPSLHRGWIGTWKPDDYGVLNEQIEALRAMSRKWGNPPVIILPDVRGEDNLRRYYTVHEETFGFCQCISVFQAVELDSNGDMSPCRDYHDYVVGNVKDRTITELWNSERYVKFRKSMAADGLMPACSRCCGLMGY